MPGRADRGFAETCGGRRIAGDRRRGRLDGRRHVLRARRTRRRHGRRRARLTGRDGHRATTLYHHVRDKEDLLLLLVDEYASQIPHPDLPSEPRDRIIVAATSLNDALAAGRGPQRSSPLTASSASSANQLSGQSRPAWPEPSTAGAHPRRPSMCSAASGTTRSARSSSARIPPAARPAPGGPPPRRLLRQRRRVPPATFGRARRPMAGAGRPRHLSPCAPRLRRRTSRPSRAGNSLTSQAGRLEVPIAGVDPLTEVRAAYRELERRHTLGKIVLAP